MNEVAPPTRWRPRLADFGVFLILWASSAYFQQSRDWNSASRMILTYAIVDRQTIAIDGLDRQTGDIARYRGHYYSDKNPGLSLLGCIPYALAKRAFGLPDHPLDRPGMPSWSGDYPIALGTSGLATALAGAMLVGLARRMGCGPASSVVVGLTYGLATPAAVYATLAYGHQVASFFVVASFSLLWRDDRPGWGVSMLAGGCAAAASVVEIQLGPVSAILGLYQVALVATGRQPLRALGAFCAGAAGPTLVLLGYNWWAFGSPLRMGYYFEVAEEFRQVHSASNPLGIRLPNTALVGELLWGPRRGLLRFAPVVALVVPGAIALAMRRAWPPLVVGLSVIAAVFAVNLSYPEWTGGWSTGPRLLLPLVPFACVIGSASLARWPRSTTLALAALAAFGYVETTGYLVVGGRIPHPIDHPWLEGAWPMISGQAPLPDWAFGHRFARNVVSTWAEGGREPILWDFAPLVAMQLASTVILLALARRSGRGGAPMASPPR